MIRVILIKYQIKLGQLIIRHLGGGSTITESLYNIHNWRNLFGQRLVIDNIGYASGFIKYPSDWLPVSGVGIDFRAVFGNGNCDTTYNPPLQYGFGPQNYWWNVLTFGNSNRSTQIAFFGFCNNELSPDGTVYIRRQHDLLVQDWAKLL